jgi:hypothetical protein
MVNIPLKSEPRCEDSESKKIHDGGVWWRRWAADGWWTRGRFYVVEEKTRAN